MAKDDLMTRQAFAANVRQNRGIKSLLSERMAEIGKGFSDVVRPPLQYLSFW